MRNLYTESGRLEHMTHSRDTITVGGWGKEGQDERPDRQLDTTTHMMGKVKKVGETNMLMGGGREAISSHGYSPSGMAQG